MTNATLAAVLHDLRLLVEPRDDRRQDDRQLLERFLTRREEDAFALLIRRHGRMVLSACRRVLRDEADVEDAFQATFLVLLRRAPSMAWRTSIGAWLFGVAHRVAVRARANMQRRQHRENEASRLRSELEPPPDLSWREAVGILHEELDRLPDRYRLPLLLCYFDGNTREEAAAILACSTGAIKGRLERGREMLRTRLLRRGLTLSAALLTAASLAAPPASALPVGLMAKTMKAVSAMTAGEGLAGVVSASVAALVESSSLIVRLGKVKLAAVLVLATSLAAGGLLAHPVFEAKESPPRTAEKGSHRSAAPSGTERQRNGERLADLLEVHGVVRGPDGKPIAGAKIYGGHTKAGMIHQAVTGKDGRYRFTLRRDDVDPKGYYADPWDWATIAASADGCGLAWKELRERGKDNRLDLRLVKDDVPLEGRILDLEGQPVAGATIRVVRLHATIDEDLSAFLNQWIRDPYAAFLGARLLIFDAEEMKNPPLLMRQEKEPMRKLMGVRWPIEWRRLWHVSQRGLIPPLKTDREGKFRLTGLGRERVVEFIISGAGIEQALLRAVTRREVDVKALNKPPADYPFPWPKLHGPSFEHVAAPTKPIIGVVRDKLSNKPLAGIRIIGHSPLAKDGPFFQADIETVTDEKGAYRLTGLPKDRDYSLLVGASEGVNYLPQARNLTDTLGIEPLKADFELEQGVLIEGRLLDQASGQPVPGEISYIPLPSNSRITSTQENVIARFLLDKHFVGKDGKFRFVAYPGSGIVYAAAAADKFLPISFTPEEKKLGLDEGVFVAGQFLRIKGQACRVIDPKANTKSLKCNLAFQAVSPGR